MQYTRDQIKTWLSQHLEGTLSDPAHALFMQTIASVPDPKFWSDLLTEVMRNEIPAATSENLQPILQGVLQRIEVLKIPERKAKIHFLKTAWFHYPTTQMLRWTSAAAVIILFGVGAYLWNTQDKKKKPVIAQNSLPPAQKDISPGSNKAILTLSNGRRIELDPSSRQSITDSSLELKNANGLLSYDKSDIALENTMTTPKGGQYQLSLADGTRVWLNAASSITYPTAFPGANRTVEITGEAYFEVAKNVKKPFIVQTKKDKITVLGTSFNVNAYEDEPFFKTSLLQGSVRVNNTLMKPGQAFANGKIYSTTLEQDIAWKNGLFDFEGADLQTVLRQLARWYDIDVQYTGAVRSQTFKGAIQRDLRLSEVLDILKDMNVRYHLEGRILIIE